MNPPAIPEAAWSRIPLAKRRLLLSGPPDLGSHSALRTAVICAAAELRVQAITEEDAVAACLGMPFTLPVSRRKVEKNVRDFVRYAYHPPNGQPILSGCPRDPHHSGEETPGALRDSFRPYCDGECAKSCLMLRGTLSPTAIITGSPFRHVYASTLWVGGGKGLGPNARLVYERLAVVAAHDPAQPVHYASRTLAGKLNHVLTDRLVRDKIRVMATHGLIEIVRRNKGLYRLAPLTPEQVANLETELGTREEVEARRRAVAFAQQEYEQKLPDWSDDPTFASDLRNAVRAKRTKNAQ